MTEGDWIAMPGVPLITAGDPEAAVADESNVTDAPGDGAPAAEGATGPTSEEAHVDRATGPSYEAERTEAAVETVSPEPTSLEAAAIPEVDATPAPDEAAPVAVNTEENVGGDTSETAHAAELDATLLAATSPVREGPTEPAAAAPAEDPVAVVEAEVSRGTGPDFVNRRNTSFWSRGYAKH
jgi:hypothetical protein